MIDNIIFRLLVLDGNETNLIDDYYKTTYEDYKRLVHELVKKKYDVRYCTLDDCKCHPEHTLRELAKDKELMKFISSNTSQSICDDMIAMINGEYKAETVFNDTGLRVGIM